MNHRLSQSFLFLTMMAALTSAAVADTSLSLGADYRVRGVDIEEPISSLPKTQYYEQRLQGYLVTDLSRDVEATIRVQSITPWGMETSTSTLQTRYPDANGEFWVQNAFGRLPRLFRNTTILTVGRQPLKWGDGLILSDDDLGFNAIRAQFTSPWQALPFNLDAFTAKIDEGLQTPSDTDLHGVKLGFKARNLQWEVMGLFERSEKNQAYEMGAETTTATASLINRKIYGVRFQTDVQDAYIKGAYFFQDGDVRRVSNTDITLDGQAWMLGLGAKTNTERFGRFGTKAEIAVGDGDDANTENQDEAFRPTFASRWDGLSRKGYGRFFAATFSDAYSSTSPFSAASSVNDGLPGGVSGIQSIRFNLESTPWPKWTFSFDYYQYKAQKNISGDKDLGSEFNYEVAYRYSGLVTLRAFTAQFEPGEAFDQATKQDASYSAIEMDLKF